MSDTLLNLLLQLPASGPGSFEALVALLLENLTGHHYRLAQSGTQQGRDISAHPHNSNIVYVECKRYRGSTGLNERELLGEMQQATSSNPNLDVWALVTTRDINSQLHEELSQMAREKGIEYISISAGDGTPSTLEALCAQGLHPILQFLRTRIDDAQAQVIADQLASIANQAEYAQRIERLLGQLSSPFIGYENWRERGNQQLLAQFSSVQESRSNFGQPLNIQDPGICLVERHHMWQELDHWLDGWEQNRSPFVLLGEEGDGKTWSVASWLCRRIANADEFPPTIFFTSSTVSTTDPFELLSGSISRLLLNLSPEQWGIRLHRWISSAPETNPTVIVVLDGINERRDPLWWRELLERLGGTPWVDHVATIVTCRTAYWRRDFQSLTWLSTGTHTTLPYDDAELSAALSYHGLRRTNIPDTLLPLIRKPRYLELMIRHRSRMAESGDVTIARLVYEDWRDRFERKRHIPVDHQSFQNIIRGLADRFRNVPRQHLSEQEIATVLPQFREDAAQLVFEELRTGGILQESRTGYQVNENMLKYGLGLLLVDQIEQAVAADQSPEEAIAEWLEPYAEIDIKAAICGFAALQALGIPELPTDAKASLLATWVSRQNPELQTGTDFVAYFPRDPQSYIQLAEIVWADNTENAWAQDLLQRAFLCWSGTPRVESLLQSAFTRWLGFVHLYGFPTWRGDTEEKAEETRQKINERLGYELVSGPFMFDRYQLTTIDDDGLLRLGRVALAVISHLSKHTYIDAIVAGCVAEAIMGGRDKYDLFAWVIRTSREPLWDAIGDAVRPLIASDHHILKQVAYRLLSFDGGVEACQLQGTLPSDLFPRHPLQEVLDRDHCFNRSPWGWEQYQECLQRTDLEAQFVARQLRDICIDPDLSIPQQYADQFDSLPNSIQAHSIWSTKGTGSEDHKYEQFEPALCALAPEATATFIRGVARTTADRTGMALRQVSHQLKKHSLGFNDDEYESINQAWLRLIENNEHWDEAQETAEFFLFPHVLCRLEGQQQLRYIADRPENAQDLLSYEKLFVPITDWQGMEWLWAGELGTRALIRALWFFSANAQTIPAELLTVRILPLIDHQDSRVRAMALKTIYHSHNSTAIEGILSGTWNWDTEKTDDENHWGSLILAEFGSSIPLVELRCRLHPTYLGYAVQCRQAGDDELGEYAADLHAIWSAIGRASVFSWTDLPEMEIQVDLTVENPLEQDWVGIPSSAFSRTITFVNRNASWGGLRHNSQGEEQWNNDWGNWVNRQQRDARVAFEQAMKQQVEIGNHWFGRHFYSEPLDEVLRIRPDLANSWLNERSDDQTEFLRRLHQASSFYQALCMSLLRTDPDRGVELYSKLRENRVLLTYGATTHLSFIEYALFEAEPTSAVVSAWEQRLDECTHDSDLLKVAILANTDSAKSWLHGVIRAGTQSEISYQKARAIVLMGFCEIDDITDEIDYLSSAYPQSSWWTKLLSTAKLRQQKKLWCRHWFQRFWSSDHDDLAWASFRLFLRCVDSRYWQWQERFLPRAEHGETVRKRCIFLEANTDTIKNHIRANEQELEKAYLGQKALDGEVWPWMT